MHFNSNQIFKKITHITVLSCFLISFTVPSYAYSQSRDTLPKPGVRVRLSNNVDPIQLRGIRLYADNPFKFNFIVHKGSIERTDQEIKQESLRLIKYFFTCLAFPSKDLWVNLSPNEKNRIMEKKLAKTDLGRDFLAQDYLLKQLTSSLIYPEDNLGKSFWKSVNSNNGRLDVLSKIWITSDQGTVVQDGLTAYVTESRLKVLHENNYVGTESLIPVIEKEVNHGAHFVKLRQIYHAFMLASWFKNTLKEHILQTSYVDQHKVSGIHINEPDVKEKIYARYLEAFQKGVFNYIKEEKNSVTGEVVPRKYFSGGIGFDKRSVIISDVSILGEKDQAIFTSLSDDASSGDLFIAHSITLTDNDEPLDDKALLVKRKHSKKGYIEESNLRIGLGEKVELKAHAPVGTHKVILYSNMSGEWKEEERPLSVLKNNVKGHDVYSIKVTPEDSFDFTFIFEDSKGTRNWADLPYGNGRVVVNHEFKGSIACIGMEFRPFIMAGGQGDVMYELPKALSEIEGNEVDVIIPKFKSLRNKLKGYNPVDTGIEFEIPLVNRKNVTIKVFKTKVDNMTVYLLDADDHDLFYQTYSSGKEDVPNGKEIEFYESILLSRGSLELLKRLGKKPDIINNHDHHSGLVSLYMRTLFKKEFEKSANHFTIHNIGYQGKYENLEWLKDLGLGEEEWLKEMLIMSDAYGPDHLNLLAIPPAVIKHLWYKGHYVSTVSPTYANEIRATMFGVDRLLQDIGGRFGGLLNGIDFFENDPATDEVLKSFGFKNYSITQGINSVIDARKENKRKLQELLSKDAHIGEVEDEDHVTKYGYLEVDASRLLIANHGRTTGQKQIDIVADIIEDMIAGRREKQDVDFVIGGPTSKDTVGLKDRLIEIAERAKSNGIDMNFCYLNGFIHNLPNLLLASVDMYVIPSDFEPSGIVQQLALRYGAVPIVRKTGGLADTVWEVDRLQNGIVFNGTWREMGEGVEVDKRDAISRKQNADELYDALLRAVDTYTNHEMKWKRIIKNGMENNNDWSRIMPDYKNVYWWLKTKEMEVPDAAIFTDVGGINLDQNADFNFLNQGSVARNDVIQLQTGERLILERLQPVILNISPIENLFFDGVTIHLN